MCLNVDGGYWCKGQKLSIWGDLAQYSNYEHSSRVHKATAMANGEYGYSYWEDPGTPAKATSPYFYSLNTYKSYYDVQ
ncbi:lactococcin 972 family bacteriocin [Bacillus sp. S13(2024)]|uniref:lactococcin 972 family bacteriocin n=1 Tax=Bacillus sp. S13(2024) TaxID=3162885 RepID=UPI003D22A3B0